MIVVVTGMKIIVGGCEAMVVVVVVMISYGEGGGYCSNDDVSGGDDGGGGVATHREVLSVPSAPPTQCHNSASLWGPPLCSLAGLPRKQYFQPRLKPE